MYIVTKYIFLKCLQYSLDCGVNTIPFSSIENVVVRYLPVYSNIVSVSDPNEVLEEVSYVVSELNDILLEGLNRSNVSDEKKERIKEILNGECVSMNNNYVSINKVCSIPLTKLVEFILNKFEVVKNRSDVSLTGHIINLIDDSTPWDYLKSEICKR